MNIRKRKYTYKLGARKDEKENIVEEKKEEENLILYGFKEI